MIQYLDALNIIKEQPASIKTVEVPLLEAIGRVSAKLITSNANVPSFCNSAMDGFALKAQETVTATKNNPIQFQILKSIAAGEQYFLTNIPAFSAVEIMTGAPVPAEYNAVIPVENVVIAENGNAIQITTPANHKDNIRAEGEDFAINSPVIQPGNIITSRHLMALAAIGVGKMQVRNKPTIAVICTGNELISDYSIHLQNGQIRNSNATYLQATIPTLHSDLHSCVTLSDDPDNFIATVQQLINSAVPPTIILSTGAVSQGRKDFIPQALKQLGAKIFFHKVAIKPGKPILFALLPNGTYFFGLPGNPISVAVGLRFFVYPLLQQILTLPPEKPVNGKIITATVKKSNLRFFYKAQFSIDNNGEAKVEILPGQESFKISPLLKTNCWAVLTENKTEYAVNEVLEVYPFHPIN